MLTCARGCFNRRVSQEGTGVTPGAHAGWRFWEGPVGEGEPVAVSKRWLMSNQSRVGFHCNKFIFQVLQMEISKNWTYVLKLWVRQLWTNLSLLHFSNRKNTRWAGSGWMKGCPEPMAKAWVTYGRSPEGLMVPLQPTWKISGGFHQSTELRYHWRGRRTVPKPVGWKGFNTERSTGR